jgi:hypothetical protein
VSRYGYTGQAQAAASAGTACPPGYTPNTGGPTDINYQLTCRLQQDVCPNNTVASCPFDVNQLQFTVTNYANLNELGTYTGLSYGPGLSNQVAQYTITYRVPFATGVLAHQMGGGIPISGFAIVYNEPFT